MIIPMVNTNIWWTGIANTLQTGSVDGTIYHNGSFIPGAATNVVTPNPGIVYSDLVQPTYPGYFTTGVSWGLPYPAPDGSLQLQSNSKLFRRTSTGVPQSIATLFLFIASFSPVGNWVWSCGSIPTPIPMANKGDGFSAIFDQNIGVNPALTFATIVM